MDAAFVIMDEPTAALDPVSECEVFAGFDKMVGNKRQYIFLIDWHRVDFVRIFWCLIMVRWFNETVMRN